MKAKVFPTQDKGMLLEFVLQEMEMSVWVKGDEDVNPVKLTLRNNSDIADLLMSAANCGEFPYLVNNTKYYNIMNHKEVLARDEQLNKFTTTANAPLIIIKEEIK